MVERVPAAHDFIDLAHVPQQQVELVRRLVDQHAAALSCPGSPPGIGAVVGHVAPAQHVDGAQDRMTELAGVDGLLDAHGRMIEAPLADRRADHAGLLGGGDDRIAVGQRRCQRLLDGDMQAEPCRLDRVALVVGVRRADAYRLRTGPVDQFGQRVEAGHTVLGAEGRAASRPGAHRSDELAAVQRLVALGVEMPDFAATQHRGLDCVAHATTSSTSGSSTILLRPGSRL